MLFFLGIDHPHQAWRLPAAFISANSLRKRKSAFRARRWVMDSGAFRTIEMHGGYPHPVSEYAEVIKRFSSNGSGSMLAAVTQDYMCEPFMLHRTGLTIADHQRLTIGRYKALVLEDTGGACIMPVLQGYAPSDYANHVEQYGHLLRHRAWVGIGSVCRRNANPAAIEAVLLAIHAVRPDLRLHGFGIKRTALQSGLVRSLLFSADSMAWSFAARYEGRDHHDPNEALAYRRKVLDAPVQLPLGVW